MSCITQWGVFCILIYWSGGKKPFFKTTHSAIIGHNAVLSLFVFSTDFSTLITVIVLMAKRVTLVSSNSTSDISASIWATRRSLQTES